MSQTLVINGKEYLPSATLAPLYKYTSDYIGKLAREEKILGTQVGRIWFIEPESLKVFVQKTTLEKELRSEELRQQRKNEHLAFQKDQQRKELSTSLSPVKASLQATLVVACGLLVGVLGHVVSKEGVSALQFVGATRETVRYVSEGILPSRTMESFGIKAKSFLAASQEGIGKTEQMESMEESEVFGTLPTSSLEKTSANTSTKNTINPSIVTQFSDEVQIVTDQNGREFLRPLFKNQDSSSTLFMVVPVAE